MSIENLGSFSPAHQDKIRCTSCGAFVDNCDGDECDDCGSFTCYNCGVHIGTDWLCTDCADARELEMEGEEE